MNIASFDKLKAEAKSIQDFLDITMSEDPAELTARGNDLAVYISRTGKMLADAKIHKDRRFRSEVFEQLKQSAQSLYLPASTLNELLKASCENENYLMNWIERLNRTATHQLNWCRTLISKAKEEMRLSNMIL